LQLQAAVDLKTKCCGLAVRALQFCGEYMEKQIQSKIPQTSSSMRQPERGFLFPAHEANQHLVNIENLLGRLHLDDASLMAIVRTLNGTDARTAAASGMAAASVVALRSNVGADLTSLAQRQGCDCEAVHALQALSAAVLSVLADQADALLECGHELSDTQAQAALLGQANQGENSSNRRPMKHTANRKVR
jgi:hypothetical protein